MITGVKTLIDAELEGRTNTYSFRKVPSQTTTQGIWFDLALSPWNPIPKYWFGTPYLSTAISQSSDAGLYHGQAVSIGQKKHLVRTTIMANQPTALPMQMILLDYLMYYPLIDEGTTDEQFMTNTIPLPRYPTWEGVQVMAVSVAGRTGGQSFFINYTNSKWVSGRISKVVTENSSAALGAIVTSATSGNINNSLFIPLADGDTGVRSIESVTMLGTDVGLFSLVLVNVLGTTYIRENTCPVEVNYFQENTILSEIKNDAYLNFVCLPNGALNTTQIMIDLKVVWG